MLDDSAVARRAWSLEGGSLSSNVHLRARMLSSVWSIRGPVVGLLIGCVALVLPPDVHAGQAEPARAAGVPLTYAAAVERALASHPRLVAARLRRQINLASRDVAAERLNPEFRVELAKETPKEGYTLAVPWELGGKRARRVDVADAAIRTGDAELNQAMAEVQS